LTAYSNAPSESFFNSLKNERVHGTRYETRDEARADAFDYIEVFYNRRRRHSSLGGISPVSVYETWLNAQSMKRAA
jgi:putative transposase